MEQITLTELREYCGKKPGAVETCPFGEETLVFKVMDKMFALTNITWSKPAVNLKCDPDWAMMLRQHYVAVQPGYHMNKRHWNTVYLDGSIPIDEIWEMIDHSYRLVVKGLKKFDRDKLAKMVMQTG